MDDVKTLETLENDIARIERQLARAQKYIKLARLWYQKLARVCLARGKTPSFVEKAQVRKDLAFVGQLGFSKYSDLLARLDRISW